MNFIADIRQVSNDEFDILEQRSLVNKGREHYLEVLADTGFSCYQAIFSKEELRFDDIIIPEGNKCFFDMDNEVVIACKYVSDYHFIITDIPFLKQYFRQ